MVKRFRLQCSVLGYLLLCSTEVICQQGNVVCNASTMLLAVFHEVAARRCHLYALFLDVHFQCTGTTSCLGRCLINPLQPILFYRQFLRYSLR